MRTIVFHSYKGGVGRSMAVANLGIALSKRKRRVVLLDLDVNAPSMHLKFLDQGLISFPYGGPKGGYIDYLKQYYEPLEGNQGKHMILDDITLPSEEERVEVLRKYAANVGSHLKLIPSGDSESNIYWRNLNSDWIHNLLSLTHQEISQAQIGRVVELSRIKEILDSELCVIQKLFKGGTDYLLVDCRAAREYSTVALCYWADVMVSMFNASSEAIRGAVQTQQFVLKARNRNKPRIIPVICRVPEDFTSTSHEYNRVADEFAGRWVEADKHKSLDKPEPFSVLHEYRDLEIAERLLLISTKPEDKEVLLIHDYIDLFVRILEGETSVQKSLRNIDVKRWKAVLGMSQDARLLESYILRLSSGELVNKDKKRNVMVRAETLLAFMNSIKGAQSSNLQQLKIGKREVESWILGGFREAGYLIGGDFGRELMEPGRVWKRIPEKIDTRLSDWCKFDTECGFGRLWPSYQNGSANGQINWENNFLTDEHGRLQSHVREFSCGYIHGVLKELLADFFPEIHTVTRGNTKFNFRGLIPRKS